MDTHQVKQFEDMVRSVRGSANELAIIRSAIADLAGVDVSDTVWIDNVSISSATSGGLDYERDCLEKISGLGLSIAPVIAGWFIGSASEVLVRSYDVCPRERIHCVVPDPSFKVSEAARERFLGDLERLADAGFMHAACARGGTYWRYSEQTRWIVLDAWAALKPLRRRDEMFEVVRASLAYVSSRSAL
jgi:hypothetical protein